MACMRRASVSRPGASLGYTAVERSLRFRARCLRAPGCVLPRKHLWQHVAGPADAEQEMTKGVFETKAESGYDDEIAERYHFPRRYLAVAQTLVGNWIVYREPKTGGGRGSYIAAARVVRIDSDPMRPDHHYARMDGYLPFDGVVPLSRNGIYYEADLRGAERPSNVGARLQGRSVRAIANADFAAIVRTGLGATLAPENAVRLGLDPGHADLGTRALLDAPAEEQERRVVQMLTNRTLRDASFRGQVLDAYDNTCAVTGLRIVNGGGKAEAQAAHIWAVKDGGPDMVQNGLALSATVHCAPARDNRLPCPSAS